MTGTAEEPLAGQVRSWLAANWHGTDDAAWRARVVQAGWAAPTWPADSFGRGLSRAEAATVAREFRAAGAPGAAVERQGYQATGGSSLASLGKLANSRILHRGWALRHRLLGPRGMLYDPADAAAYEVDHELMWSFITSVGGGTDQIQRNIIGERILGLPKGHEPASPGKPPRSCTTSGPGRQRSSWATPPPTARPSPNASASSPRRSRLLVLAGPGF